jgi:hypothetical protein
MNVTTPPLSVQSLVELSVTDVAPSPLVLTVGVKLPPTVTEPGMFEIVGVVGVPWPMLKVCALPSTPT